ncbi:MAG: hypothetical protein KGM16_12830 [Bacteroidota bacterium]|nr:hypothetical protein [Bacteroidota bacterium]
MFFHNLNPARFTIPKMNKKPTLPADEMLSKLSTFTKIKVATAVIIKPSGCFQRLAKK